MKFHIEIEYRYSEIPIDRIVLLGEVGELLSSGLQSSQQWKWERDLGGLTTDCFNALAPKNRRDISLSFLVGFEKGVQIIEMFQMAAIRT